MNRAICLAEIDTGVVLQGCSAGAANPHRLPLDVTELRLVQLGARLVSSSLRPSAVTAYSGGFESLFTLTCFNRNTFPPIFKPPIKL